jgi:two-component system, chemotaxis family, sensor kinase CheA
VSDNNAYLGLFIDEAKENLESLNHALLELEKSPGDKPTLDNIFRVAHTLKGMAAAMGFEGFKDLTHKMEDLFGAFKTDELTQVPSDMDLLFSCLDALSEDLEEIEAGSYQNNPHTDLCTPLMARFDDNTVDASLEALPQKDSSTTLENSSKDISLEDTVLSSWQETILTQFKQAESEASGDDLFEVTVTLDPSSPLPSVRAFMVQDLLKQQCSDILSSHPFLDESALESLTATEYHWMVTHNQLKRDSDQAPLLEQLKNVGDVVHVSIQLKSEMTLLPSEVSTSANKEKMTEGTKDAKDPASQAKTVRIPMGRIDQLVDLVGELVISRTRLIEYANRSESKDLMTILHNQSSITNELQELVMKLRMEPIEKMFSRFPRVVRDVSKMLNKSIELVMTGEDTEVDRVVNEELAGALIHLIRNSLDHGIEMPEDRRAAGKSPTGTVTLAAANMGDVITISITDDGRGLNRNKLTTSAVNKGLITPEQASKMSDRDVYNLIFMPGFSTAAVTTDISGRGVGMDVVKSTIDKLGGHVEIESEEGQGTRILITLPTSMAIINVLLVNVGHECYALPLASVREIVDIPKSEVRQVGTSEMIIIRGEVLPLKRLSSVTGYSDSTLSDETIQSYRGVDEERLLLVVVRLRDQFYCLEVDNLQGQQEAVVKPLPGIVSGSNLYSGVMTLGNGDIVLIMNPVALFATTPRLEVSQVAGAGTIPVLSS